MVNDPPSYIQMKSYQWLVTAGQFEFPGIYSTKNNLNLEEASKYNLGG